MALLYPEESYAIRGAIFEVHKQKGTGFLERVYQECLEREFRERAIPFEREKRIKIDYKGFELKQDYVADFVCYDKIIVECKAVKEITDTHRAQIINYLRATNLRLGFLVNFGELFVIPERIINFHWQPE